MLLSQPATQQIVYIFLAFVLKMNKENMWHWNKKKKSWKEQWEIVECLLHNSLSWIHSLSYLVSYLWLSPCTKMVTCCISDQRTFVIHGYLRWTCPLENVHLDVPFLIPPEDLTLVGRRALRVCAGSTEFTNILFSKSFVPDGWVGSPSAAAYQFEMRSVST